MPSPKPKIINPEKAIEVAQKLLNEKKELLEKLKLAQETIRSVKEDLKMEHEQREKACNETDFFQAELHAARKVCESRVNVEGKTLVATIRDVISRQERECEKLYERTETLKQENDRLWYMIGVAVKDPNTLRSSKKIGVRPSYAQPTYGEMINQDTAQENY